MRHRRTISVLAVALIASALPPTAQAAPPTHAAQTPPHKNTSTSRITLVTGDRVQVTSRPGQPEKVVFEPGPTSRSTAAVTTYTNGHTYVVPEAARKDVSSGRLDRALFDVTTLIAEGQDDAKSKTLPVIVRYGGAQPKQLKQLKQLKGTTNSRTLKSINAQATKVEKTKAADFWDTVQGVQKVSLDRTVSVQLDQSVPQIGGPAAWERGLTGKGVKIAVLDSGIDPNHADFTGRIGAQQNFTDTADTVDHHGHGTHVASIAAGTGAADGGKHKGVAPDATLLIGKVLDDTGSGSFSGIIAGMEWAAAQGADVVNLSLGSREPSDGTDEVSQAVNQLTRTTGTLFVVAAGNCFFPQPGTVTSPAAADEALAVGNLQRDGSLNDSSCRGPRAGDGAIKPELSAPGTGIVAARAAGTELGEPVDDNYTALSGTSMASPHVAGVAALVAQAHPDWQADRLKAQLISTADPQQGRVDEEGAGRVDGDQATDQSVTVDTGELELGTLRWPFPAKEELTKTLTYSNPTSEPVTLQLEASTAETPQLSATQLVVPANGTAAVQATFDRAAAGVGKYSGRITATPAGQDPIVTTYGWYAEPEMYDLTIQGIAKDGSAAQTDVNIARLDGDPMPDNTLPLRDGKVTARLAPGRYVVSTVLFTDPTDSRAREYSVLSTNELQVDKNLTTTLDARTAKPIDLTAQGATGMPARERAMGYTLKNTDGLITGGTGISWTGAARLTSATPTTKLTTGSSEFALGARLERAPYQAKVRGGKAFEVLDFYFGPRFTGTKNLPLYDAGTATPEELKGAKGKLALIRLSDSDPRWNGQVTRAAEDAGAAAVLLYNPDYPGMNGVSSYWAYGDQDATIPAMRTSRANAQALLKAMPATIQVSGVASTPYVYDLMQPWANQIPAAGTHTVKKHQLATVSETFGSHTPGMQTSESRGTSTPGGNQSGGWLVPTFATPFHRVSYVQADHGLSWESGVYYNNTDDGGAMAAHGAPVIYRPGRRSAERWLKPVLLSGLPAGVQYTQYVDGGLQFQVSPFQHQQEWAAPYNNPDSLLTLERNGEQVGTAEDTGIWLELPDDAASYKATLDTRRESNYWKYSTQVKSTWTWRSKGGADEVMPLVLADLDVPQADATSQVRTGRPTAITFGLRHQTGSQSTAKFTKATLSLSYDGGRWTDLPLKTTADGRWITTVTHPNSQAGQAPSLKLTGTDADGNALEQEVTRAYGLVR
ncbi:S8 family serine peptidase [Kribbella lupini]|uniref:S8 family serine peptidase n=1 Tax=Kribbella lupini TaxID=291602 RepID=A0ABN2BK90_9ACTN